jgi:pimeloyl-ACP methyl ester carboxylesterase
MKIIKNLFRLYFQFLSFVSPEQAAKQAIRLFQKTQKNKVKPRELSFYQYSRPFQVASEVEAVNCFEMGPKDGPIVFLIHGWNSRAGSMGAIGFRLMKKGYRVIGIDLPGHGLSSLTHTNLIIESKALKAVIEYIDPQQPISVVAHSFGSAVTTFTLSQMEVKVDQLIYLTTPNKMTEVFEQYSAEIGLSAKAFHFMEQHFIALFGRSWKEFVMRDMTAKISYQSLLLIHDKFDKAIPYKNAVDFAESLDRSRLHKLEKVGHYRMLWDKDVIDVIAKEFVGEREYTKEEKLLAAAF